MPAAISPMVARRDTLFMRSSARCASLSARRWSVMSSPESMTPVATLSASRSATPRQVMNRSSPSDGAHVVFAALRLVAAAHEQRAKRIARDGAVFRRHAAIYPVAVDDLRVVHAAARACARWLTSCTAPARLVATSMTCARSRYRRLTLAFVLERGQRLAAQRRVVQEADELRRIGVGDAARRSGTPRIRCRRDAGRARRVPCRGCAARRRAR